MKRILYWFRNDLRLHDNEGFYRATQDADEVIPVYCFDLRLFRPLRQPAIQKTGVFRAQFLLESVADLRNNLIELGGNLIVRTGHPEQVLWEMARDLQADAIYASKEVTQEETEVESGLSKRLKGINVDIELFWESTLYHVRDLPFNVSRMPDVFTSFRQQIENKVRVRPTFPLPDPISVPREIEVGELPELAQLGFSELPAADPRAAISFRGGERAGLERLRHYFWGEDHLRNYKETRNGMLGTDFSSKFSAWLALGCLSPRHVYEEVRRYESERIANDSTYWLVFELLWRDFFRFIALKYGTRIFKPGGIKMRLGHPFVEDRALFDRWANGQTGVPLIDAAMRELNATGFLSNRARQNVASFLIHDLNLNWTWGAAYFEAMLTDYDPASNWGNWCYTAGVGNDPRPNRYFNIYSQALRYDEQGEYVRHWLPELARVPADRIHRVWTLNPAEQDEYGLHLGTDYPLPIINADKWLSPESIR
ncbi:DASH family cryptochrome [Tellurirhabdus rosea]|uniref:DASH family cryptochrome n=1 Tax=Tellurirhabdus rosea TaxID=2674997 RepID=UPI00225AB0F8|nr:DASH family cryptochrome [Tellurirhabdus rosea]